MGNFDFLKIWKICTAPKNSLNCGRIWKGERKGKTLRVLPKLLLRVHWMPSSLSVSSKMLWFGLKRNIKYLSKLLIWSQPQMCILIDPKPEESYNVKGSKYIKWSFDIEGQNRVQKKSFWKVSEYLVQHTFPNIRLVFFDRDDAN